jgi:hypothetical protein
MAQQIQPPQIQNAIGHLRSGGPNSPRDGRSLNQQGAGTFGAEVFSTIAFNQLLQQIIESTQGVEQSNGAILVQLGPINLFIGSGSPAGVVIGSPPDIYLNSLGGAGTTIYIKESGSSTAAGWAGK